MPNRRRCAAALAAAICLSAATAGARPAKHPAARPLTGAQGEAQAAAALEHQLARAREALERLDRDARRRRYRDGWEAIARDLEARADRLPASAQAPRARLLAAEARERLWNVSRSRTDARAAIDAYRRLEERQAGWEIGRRAIVAAARLAQRAGERGDLAACAARLARYPASPDVQAALAAAQAASAAKQAALEAAVDAAAARQAAGRAAPVKARAPAAPPAVPSKEIAPGGRAARAGRDAPVSPEREPDSDVPAEAARILDSLVQAVREQGASDLVGDAPRQGAPAPAAAPSQGERASPAGPAAAPAPPAGAPGGPAAAVSPPAAEGGAEADEGPAEPEEAEEEPLPRRTRASAPRSFPEEEPPEAEARARELRSTALEGGGSLAAQLGLKVHTVAIDAGHGGRDAGAIGRKGLREKDATLAIARKLAARLKGLGFRVVMTRTSDRYVGLSERTRIANRAQADLFLSIHCNAAGRRGLAGVETWTLNTTSDRYAQRLAAFENAEADATVGKLRLILADLATKANANEARALALGVQSALVRTLRSRVGRVQDHGVKQALFYVLLGAHMPSVLVETAFLSNPEEEKRLRSARYQEGTAEAIARGVKEFVDSQRRLAMAGDWGR